MDLEALKLAALATLKNKKSSMTKSLTANAGRSDLESLRDAALKSQALKSTALISSDSQPPINDTGNSTGSDLVSAPSKFTRCSDSEERSDDDTSEISILEEVDAASDSDIEHSNIAGGDASAAVQSSDDEDKAIPDLLQESVDIAEFDDDDLLLEEELMVLQPVRQKDEPRTAKKKPKSKTNNGVGTKNSAQRNAHRDVVQTKPTAQRSVRSKSRRELTRSSSPHQRRSHTSPSQYQNSSPIRQRLSPANRPIQHSADVRDRLSSTSAGRTESRNKVLSKSEKQLIENSDRTNPLEDPSLTEEERQTLVNRKEKFSVHRISSSKKTVKLNESSRDTKKKSSSFNKTKKSKVIRVKSQSPDVVETVSLEKETASEQDTEADQSVEEVMSVSTAQTTAPSAAGKVGKRSLKERLGGFVKPEVEPIVKKHSRHDVSLDSSSESEAKSSKIESKAPKSQTTHFKRRVILDDELPSQVSKRELSTGGSEIHVTKRNIWSRREPSGDLMDTRKPELQKDLGTPRISLTTAKLRSRMTKSRQTEADSQVTARSSHIQKHDGDMDLQNSLPSGRDLKRTMSSHRMQDDDELLYHHIKQSKLTIGSSRNSNDERLGSKVHHSDKRSLRDAGGDTDERSRSRPSRLRSEDKETRKSAWASGRSNRTRDSVSFENHPHHKTESTGKSVAEKELDERIRKIKEQNAKREERQKLIEQEKRIFS